MKTLLTLICSLALVAVASAAQHDDNNFPQPKKKGGGPQPGTQAVQTGPKNFKTKTFNPNAGVTGHQQFHPNTLPSVQTTAKTTTFKQNHTINKNITVNNNFHVQHFNLAGKPGGKYHAVTFNQNYKIAGAHNWKGAKYSVFVNYHPQWHDQGWWRSHHDHIVFVFGAPYFWDAGYYYPAWGYDPGAEYYYDGPIYTGSADMDPGQAVANVQSALQEQGFYHGDIDGVLGPQTRAALAEYQQSQGLEPTGAMDEPTLESLGMAS
jgi:hypothetical protein